MHVIMGLAQNSPSLPCVYVNRILFVFCWVCEYVSRCHLGILLHGHGIPGLLEHVAAPPMAENKHLSKNPPLALGVVCIHFFQYSGFMYEVGGIEIMSAFSTVYYPHGCVLFRQL